MHCFDYLQLILSHNSPKALHNTEMLASEGQTLAACLD